VRDVLLDAVEVGPRLRLEVDDDAAAPELRRQELDPRPDQAALVEVRADALQELGVRSQLLELELPVGRLDALDDVDPRDAVPVRRDRDAPGHANRSLAAEELEVLLRHGPVACPDLERGPLPRAVEGLGVDAAERRLGVLHARDSRDAALEDGERPRRDVPATTAAVAVVAEAN